jgi:hypothetical protein
MRTGFRMLDLDPAHTEARGAAAVSHMRVRDPVYHDPTLGRGIGHIRQRLSSPFSLATLLDAYLMDSYIHRAVGQYVSLIMKNGWRLKARNKKAVEYLQTRLKSMAYATGWSSDELINAMATDVVLFGNAYLVKVRARTDTPIPGLKLTGFRGNRPIIGLYPAPPQHMYIDTDDTGHPILWKQIVYGRVRKEWKPAEIIHIRRNALRGTTFGVPHLVPVLEDVRVLRQIEQNVIMLLYRNLNPILQVKVGIPPGIPPGMMQEYGQLRIQRVKDTIRNMPPDGWLVTEADVDIEVKGFESQALRATPYMEVFKQRVFAGLSVSGQMMGNSNSSTRSTAEQITADMHDTVRSWQSFLSDAFSKDIFFEMLYEGGFDPLSNEDDNVKLDFGEVDIDTQIKRENHYTQLYVQGVLSLAETRDFLGLDPMTPEQMGDTYVYNVTIPAAEAQAAARAFSSSSTGGTSSSASPKVSKTKSTPRRSGGAKPPPEASAIQRVIEAEISGLTEALVSELTDAYEDESRDLSGFPSGIELSTSKDYIESKYHELLTLGMKQGYYDKCLEESQPAGSPHFESAGVKLCSIFKEDYMDGYELLVTGLERLAQHPPEEYQEAKEFLLRLLDGTRAYLSEVTECIWQRSYTEGKEL